MKYFNYCKLLNALKAVICLDERHPTYEKTITSKIRFLKHWHSLTEEQRRTAIPDERLFKTAMKEIESLNLNDEASLRDLLEKQLTDHSNSIEHVHEYIKSATQIFGEKDIQKYETLALKALETDQDRNSKVYAAANTFRRLKKLGSTAVSYKAKAEELFKFAKIFE